jgi:hypothetical protein
VANQEKMEAKIEAKSKKFEVLQETMWTSQEEMKAKLDSNPEEVKVIQKKIRVQSSRDDGHNEG